MPRVMNRNRTRSLPSLIYRLLPLLLLAVQACHSDNARKQAKAAAVSNLERQYEAVISKMITSSLSDTAGYNKLPLALANKNYRIKGYISFIKGYHAYKNKQSDSAAVDFEAILDKVKPDTTRDRNLVTLKAAGLLRLKLDRQVDSTAFAMLFSLLEFTQRYPTRYAWWAENLAAEAWFRFGDLDRSAYYIEQSRLHFPEPDNYAQLSVFMSQFSRIASTREDFQQALRYEDSSYAYALQAGDMRRLAVSKAAQAVLYIRMGQAEKGYRLQREAFEEKKRLDMLTFQEYMNMAYTYKDQKDFATSNIYAQQGLSVAMENESDDNLRAAYECLYINFKSMGKADSATEYLKEAFNAELRSVSSKQQKEVAQLQLNLDLKEQKHKTQQLANQYKGQSLILRQQRILIFAFATSLVLAVVLAFLLIRQRRLRAVNESMELEQRLLRSQMDPHFIFNTLSVLQSFIRSNDNDRSIKYLSQFARLLRVSLENSREAFVPLRQEIEALENYLSLQAMRFEGVFEYQIIGYEGYEEDEEVMIPPMLIQPFVENAIQYGIQNLSTKGELLIKIDKEDGMILCEIDDNGHGIRKTAGSNPGKQSLSTHITRERLNILSRRTGRSANLEILNKADAGIGQGTLVKLAIPFIKSG